MVLRVKEVCKEKGTTITGLSAKLGMKQVSLSRIINGNPTIETLQKIAAALDVPFIALFEASCPMCGMKINTAAAGIQQSEATAASLLIPAPSNQTVQIPEAKEAAPAASQPEREAKTGVNLLDYVSKHAEAAGQHYMSLHHHLKQYAGEDVKLHEVNIQFINGFERYLNMTK